MDVTNDHGFLQHTKGSRGGTTSLTEKTLIEYLFIRSLKLIRNRGFS